MTWTDLTPPATKCERADALMAALYIAAGKLDAWSERMHSMERRARILRCTMGGVA